MFSILCIASLLVSASGFALSPPRFLQRSNTHLNAMNIPQGMAPPGMKPNPDGGFSVAGEHPKTYKLENDNGALAVVDTHTASVVTWKDASGVEVLTPAGLAHCFPDENRPIDGEFIPEERAKKVSFDRMIFKCYPTGMEDIEYRVDTTMRADSLEYDVIIKNNGNSPFQVSTGINIAISAAGQAAGYKVTSTSGYKGPDCKSGPITIPVGKFTETAFYFKISK